MKTIVVGYDDSAESKRALERAAELAQAFDSTLVVTSVAQLLVGAASARGISGFDPADDLEEHRDELKHAAAFLRERGLAADLVVGAGDPATQILQLADSREADLIVVGARERGLLERLVDPSVSAAVERRAHRDVLVVH